MPSNDKCGDGGHTASRADHKSSGGICGHGSANEKVALMEMFSPSKYKHGGRLGRSGSVRKPFIESIQSDVAWSTHPQAIRLK